MAITGGKINPTLNRDLEIDSLASKAISATCTVERRNRGNMCQQFDRVVHQSRRRTYKCPLSFFVIVRELLQLHSAIIHIHGYVCLIEETYRVLITCLFFKKKKFEIREFQKVWETEKDKFHNICQLSFEFYLVFFFFF